MNAYDYDTWEDYVRGKSAELKKGGLGPEFLPGACLEKSWWQHFKEHHDAVKKATEIKT
jgi:hypothetical protein